MAANFKLRLFKTYLEDAASALRVPYRAFLRDRGVSDFLLELKDEDDVITIAGLAFTQLCDEEIVSYTYVVLTAVIHLLDNQLQKPKDDPQLRRLRDLLQLAEERGDLDQFRRWAETWYG